ncbi:MAG: alkylmercury lyase [Acidimicrobiales bacterium]
MTAPSTVAAGVTDRHLTSEVHIQILRVPDCPIVGQLRALIDRVLARSGLCADIEEIDGPYPSPTLLIDGADVTGRRVHLSASCRLDLPSEQQIAAALTPSTNTTTIGG